MPGPRELGQVNSSTPGAHGVAWASSVMARPVRAKDKLAGEGSGHHRDLLAVIESDIVPRLILVHRNGIAANDQALADRSPIDPSVLAKFSNLVQHASLSELVAFVKSLAVDGCSLRSILLDLCAPTARWLGDQWVSDDLDFVAVTLSLSRLQQLVHEIIPSYGDSCHERGLQRALIVPTPGEQHAFGAVVAAQLFRESGWIVDGGLAVTADELQELVTREDYAIVGFSQSSDVNIDNLKAAIQMVRDCARSLPAAIIVGGRLAAERSELCAAVGADRFFRDTSDAVHYTSAMFARLNHAAL